jgi:hypothetical protein
VNGVAPSVRDTPLPDSGRPPRVPPLYGSVFSSPMASTSALVPPSGVS